MFGLSESRFKGGLPDCVIRHATFRQMQIFEAIVRLGSFTRAAEELFLTQPTVSTQFKKLTDVMGLPLIDQAGRQIKATEVGEELYRAIRRIFDTLLDLDTDLSELRGLSRGRLRLGVITTVKYFAPEILGEFCKLYPGVNVSLKVTNRSGILERIHDNEDDLYILGQPPGSDLNVQAYPFARNPLVVVASRDHPLCKESNITIERLAQEPFISREVGSGIRDATMKLFAQHGVTPYIRMELGSNDAIKHAVARGLGVAVLSLHSLSLEGQEHVGVLDVEGFPIENEWHLLYAKDKELSVIAKNFLEFSKSHEPNIRMHIEDLCAEFMQRPISQYNKNEHNAQSA